MEVMAPQRGQLSPLTIAAIFVVVFAVMYSGVQFSKGELLPDVSSDADEEELRAAVWAELNERRADRGVGPVSGNRFERGIAQDTAKELAAMSYFNASTAAGVVDGNGGQLPNSRLFCTQIPVKLTLSGADSTNATATAVVDLLASTNGSEALFRGAGQYRSALGVSIDDGVVYVAYRSCPNVDT